MSNPFTTEIISVILPVRGILLRGFRCFVKQNSALRRPLELLKGNAKTGEETHTHISCHVPNSKTGPAHVELLKCRSVV